LRNKKAQQPSNGTKPQSAMSETDKIAERLAAKGRSLKLIFN
jgi:hypothetical protein